MEIKIGVKSMLVCKGVFFFKQKTAYEMRNCDWSSDVCSSDLGSCGVGELRCGGVAAYEGPSGYQTLDHCVLALWLGIKQN